MDHDYHRSMEEPEKFWGEIGSQMISWDKMYDQVLDDSSSPFTRWFSGGYLNACFNCLDRHIANGQGHKVAIIHDSPITNTIRKVTYQELLDTVSVRVQFHQVSLKLILFLFQDGASRWWAEETWC